MKKTSARPNPKKRAQLLGRRAELWASLWLRLKGFGIIAKRHRNPAGEIDLIAMRGDLLVFAEVKARKTQNAAIEAVTEHARARIASAANLFISQHPQFAHKSVRFDIVAVHGWRITHMSDAWRQ